MATSSIMSKRKLPRRELPWIGPLLESLPFSKLPTNHTVLQRLYFEVERNHGSSGLDVAAVKVKNELIDLLSIRRVWRHSSSSYLLHQEAEVPHPPLQIPLLHSPINCCSYLHSSQPLCIPCCLLPFLSHHWNSPFL